MNNKSCKICTSSLEVEDTCKFCDEPTRLFCHACGVVAERTSHPACMIIDVNRMMLESSQ